MAEWYAVVDRQTGELKSVGTVVANPLPVGLEVLLLSGAPDFEREEWNAATRGFLAKPPPPPQPTPLERFAAQPEIQALIEPTRTGVLTAFNRAVGWAVPAVDP